MQRQRFVRRDFDGRAGINSRALVLPFRGFEVQPDEYQNEYQSA
jgi:hypothetical protein